MKKVETWADYLERRAEEKARERKAVFKSPYAGGKRPGEIERILIAGNIPVVVSLRDDETIIEFYAMGWKTIDVTNVREKIFSFGRQLQKFVEAHAPRLLEESESLKITV